MRDTKINVLYYPDMFVDETTLKKMILLFDEIHILDRPSFTFKNFGTIGAQSPLHQYQESFQNEGVPLFVHGVQGGNVKNELLEQVISDINDPLFLKRFKEGLKSSLAFRNLQIPPGNYGQAGNEIDVANKLADTDLSILDTYGTADNLFFDDKIKPFDLSFPLGCVKQLICQAVICSAKLNFALIEGVKHGFSPLADATPYANLLGARYIRAINKLEPIKNHIHITDLSFAIFDDLVPTENIEKISIKDVVKYRKSSEKDRKEFLEYLSMLQTKQAKISADEDYLGIIEKLIKTEIVPAANNFRNKLQTIDETFIGSLAKGVIGSIGGVSGINIFADLSWERMLSIGSVAGAYILKSAIDHYLAERAQKRDCSISYILSLDK